MAFALPISPAKTLTPTTTITEFPENPKTLILEQCKTIKDLNQVHAHLIKTRLHHSPLVARNLLESAAIRLPQTSMDYAISIFDKIDEPDSSDYNIMMRGFTSKQIPHQAVLLFQEMVEKSVPHDEFTFSCVLKACSKLRALEDGKQIHAQILKFGIGSRGFVGNSLVHMYANCGEVGVARKLFDEMSEKDVVSWNALFSGYSKSGCWEEVVGLFRYMLEVNARFNEVTLVCALTACGRVGALELGVWIDEYVKENQLKDNRLLITSLVDMYAKCGCVDTARNMFDQMSTRDVVAWSAMISGYNQANRCKEAISLFHEMRKANVEPNEGTLVSVLSSCAVVGDLETGKWAHFYIKEKKLKLTVNLGTALLVFYAKCGSVYNAVEVFEKMPVKNVFSWTILIQALASNGQGRRALQYFNLMREKNIEPNDVTFIGVLHACSIAGLVNEGRDLFVSMSRDFCIEPKIEHYGCMVDLLARAGLLEEAYQFILNMPIKPNVVVWRTLLASCKVRKNVKIGEESFKHMLRLETTHSGDYMLLSNIYASVGRWEDAVRMRREMKGKGIEKNPRCSSIEVNGLVHEFFAEDNVHPESEEIYAETEKVIEKIKSAGYVSNAAEAMSEAEEDDREGSIPHHSEKLAVTFGLIKTSPGTPIRISKNLRICGDCHNAMKFISEVFMREIVVKDRNRFHHFKDGSCSCKDNW